VAKRVLDQKRVERQRPIEPDQELEALKQSLRERARVIAEREHELDRERHKLELRERRLGRKIRLLRAERDWFAPLKAKVAERGDEGARLEKRAAKLAAAEQALGQREQELGTLRAELDGLAREVAKGQKAGEGRGRPYGGPKTARRGLDGSPGA